MPGTKPQNDRLIWLDGSLVPWDEATVHVLSHSLQRGSLICESLIVHESPRGPAIFRLREHVARLLRSAALVGLPLDRSLAELEAGVVEAVRANPGAAAVKVSAYLPSIEVDVVPLDARVAVAIAAYDPFADVIRHKPSKPHYAANLKIWIEKDVRSRRSDIVPPQAKVAANYTSPMTAKWAAKKAGYDEILLVDERGHVAEGPTTNVFWVDEQGALGTPPQDHVLLGVTRLSILEIAKHDGLSAREASITPAGLMEVPEVFLTGTTAGVWPVASIDERPIGDGGPGPVSLRLRDRFAEIVSGGDPDFHPWLTFVEG